MIERIKDSDKNLIYEGRMIIDKGQGGIIEFNLSQDDVRLEFFFKPCSDFDDLILSQRKKMEEIWQVLLGLIKKCRRLTSLNYEFKFPFIDDDLGANIHTGTIKCDITPGKTSYLNYASYLWKMLYQALVAKKFSVIEGINNVVRVELEVVLKSK